MEDGKTKAPDAHETLPGQDVLKPNQLSGNNGTMSSYLLAGTDRLLAGIFPGATLIERVESHVSNIRKYQCAKMLPMKEFAELEQFKKVFGSDPACCGFTLVQPVKDGHWEVSEVWGRWEVADEKYPVRVISISPTYSTKGDE